MRGSRPISPGLTAAPSLMAPGRGSAVNETVSMPVPSKSCRRHRQHSECLSALPAGAAQPSAMAVDVQPSASLSAPPYPGLGGGVLPTFDLGPRTPPGPTWGADVSPASSEDDSLVSDDGEVSAIPPLRCSLTTHCPVFLRTAIVPIAFLTGLLSIVLRPAW